MKTKLIAFLLSAVVCRVFSQDVPHLVMTLDGDENGDMFGVVTNAGDLNGDGYADIVIGTLNSNYVNIYFGGSSPDIYPDIVLHGEVDCNYFGHRLVGAGDVNNDGFDDLLISDSGYPKYMGNIGKIYLYLGGSPMDTIPDFTYSPPPLVDSYFGDALSGNFDVNNDGYKDFIASSYYNQIDSYGRVFLFLGGETISNSPDLIIKSQYQSDGFGYSIQGLDDINGDGYDDLAIATSRHIPSHENNQVLFYYGSNEIDTNANKIINKGDPGYGELIYKGGDFNDDGFNEFVLHEDYYDNLIMHAQNDSLLVFQYGQFGEYCGYGFASGGDLNNDGYEDFIISNYAYVNSQGKSVGKVMVFMGKEQIDTTAYFTIEDSTEHNSFGVYTAFLGDINGDGFGEFIVGAVQHNGFSKKGKVYIYSTGSITNLEKKQDSFNVMIAAYPNPFNPTTEIKFSVPVTSNVKLTIYNMMGQEIKTFESNSVLEGAHQFTWDSTNKNNEQVASGVYIYRLRVVGHDGKIFEKSAKMMLMK